LDAEIVTSREVFDEFGQGVRDPGCIRELIRYCLDNLELWPKGVVLVGDSHHDVLNLATSKPVTMIAWIMLGSEDGECQDDFFVLAHEGSTIPELPICRIPVDNAAELSNYTAKLMIASSPENRGSWRNRALLIADDEWGQAPSPTYANERDHTWNCELLADDVMPSCISREKFYLIEYPFPSLPEHSEKPEARTDLIQTLSQGHQFVGFFGHGAPGQICHEKLMLSSDVSLITNGTRLSFSFWASCDVGHFDQLAADCIAEELVNSPVGGSFTSVAATRGTVSVANRAFFSEVTELLTSEHPKTISEAIWISKLSAYNVSEARYVVLGDGWLPLDIPASNIGLTLTSPDTLFTGQVNQVHVEAGMECTVDLLVSESGQWVDYICLGGKVLDYLRYGAVAFQGLVDIPSVLSVPVDFFMPVQSATDTLGRVGCTTTGLPEFTCGALEWVAVVEGETGGSGDTEGPDCEMWIDGYRGIENPSVPDAATLRAQLSDTSGICIFGGSAGRAILLSIDQQGIDVTQYFNYYPGSYTSGELTYELPSIEEGSHRLILAAWDGLGNSTTDTLDFSIVDQDLVALSEVIVYPNPGSGARCFSFVSGCAGTVDLDIFTVSGRCIKSLSQSCGAGYNQLMWDGLDADGDRLATGAYVYRLVLRNEEDGEVGEHVEVLAVVNED
jgi:hypothetical protein